ncbi:hypothetical protein HIM_00780 [Hirsutella minnesotensis 3608]|nr:hypothetical protein HIM_00780 [Hirsutella minnesotensis 3608]
MRAAATLGAALLASRGISASSPAQQPLSIIDGSSSGTHSADASSEAPGYRGELLRLHRDLVSIESISGDEGRVGRFLDEHLAAKGYRVQRQRVAPREGTPEGAERFNLLAWHGPEDARPRVVVTSHIDTVPPFIPYGIADGAVDRDTVITGRGTNDAKGSVAAMVVALDELPSRPTSCSDALFGQTTVNIGRFDGGVAANVIPEHALVKLGIRVASGSELHGAAEVQRRIQAILDDVDADAISLDCKQGYGPVKCSCDVPGFETVVVNYGTDVPNMQGDHARYLYGPGSILVAHGAHENVTVGHLETAVEGYKKLILHALKHNRSLP